MIGITRQFIQRSGARILGLWLVVFVASMWPPCCDAGETVGVEQHHEHTVSKAIHGSELRASDQGHHGVDALGDYCSEDSLQEHVDDTLLRKLSEKDERIFFTVVENDHALDSGNINSESQPVHWLNPVFLRRLYLTTHRLRI